MATETDEVGNEIILDLGTQRGMLERMGKDLSMSRRVLRRMYTFVISNKIMIILTEIGILAGGTYWKYKGKGQQYGLLVQALVKTQSFSSIQTFFRLASSHELPTLP